MPARGPACATSHERCAARRTTRRSAPSGARSDAERRATAVWAGGLAVRRGDAREPPARRVAPQDDVAVVLLERGALLERRGDLDVEALPRQRATDPDGPRVRIGGVADEDHGATTLRGRRGAGGIRRRGGLGSRSRHGPGHAGASSAWRRPTGPRPAASGRARGRRPRRWASCSARGRSAAMRSRQASRSAGGRSRIARMAAAMSAGLHRRRHPAEVLAPQDRLHRRQVRAKDHRQAAGHGLEELVEEGVAAAVRQGRQAVHGHVGRGDPRRQLVGMDGGQGEVAAGVARLGVAGHARRPAPPEAQQHERRVGHLEHRLGRLVEPDVRPEAAPEQAGSGSTAASPSPRGCGRAAVPAGGVHGSG